MPLWIVSKILNKHNNKRWRIVIDYRPLNEKSLAYPLHSILEILGQLRRAKYCSDFSVASEFYQIGMEESDAEKSAFPILHGHTNVCIRFEKGAGNVPGNVPSLKDYIFTGLQV